MKAVVHRTYGSPDVLELTDVPVPVPDAEEVQVRVVAAAVNPGDWDLLHGTPYILRPVIGLRRPRRPIPGLAVAGRVEAVGDAVSGLGPGEEVYGEVSWLRQSGGFAEYVCVPADDLAAKPPNLTFEQAAAVPVVGVAALQALRDVGRLQPGQQVLINGAAGGVGTFAVQIAKAFGARVTGVCGPHSVELVSSIGADRIVDYTREDFTTGGDRYDLILDNVGNRSLSELRRALAPNGTLIPNSNKSGGRWVGRFLARGLQALLLSPFTSQRLRPLAASNDSQDLAELTEMIETGKVTPVIDRIYPLRETPEALAFYGKGHTHGKIIITMQDEVPEGGA